MGEKFNAAFFTELCISISSIFPFSQKPLLVTPPYKRRLTCCYTLSENVHPSLNFSLNWEQSFGANEAQGVLKHWTTYGMWTVATAVVMFDLGVIHVMAETSHLVCTRSRNKLIFYYYQSKLISERNLFLLVSAWEK